MWIRSFPVAMIFLVFGTIFKIKEWYRKSNHNRWLFWFCTVILINLVIVVVYSLIRY